MRLSREAGLKLYLAALWLACLYRAVTQSIVHDEALTYPLYLAGPAARIFDLLDGEARKLPAPRFTLGSRGTHPAQSIGCRQHPF